MEEIVNRLIEDHRIDEMAMKQSEAISHCKSLGKRFIEHYHKVYIGGIQDRDFNHHCNEMQAWYDDVKSIKLKTNNRFLSKIHLIDWFFTVCAGVEDFIEDEVEADTYDMFVLNLLSSDRTVEDLMRDLLSNKEGN